MNWLAKLLRKTSKHRSPAQDAVLGLIEWDPGVDAWVSPPTSSRPFQIALSGELTPDERLLPFARELHADARAFERSIADALERETNQTPELAETILSLEIEVVELPWPDRPRCGMVYFRGGDDEPVWRFDLVDGRPVNLGRDG